MPQPDRREGPKSRLDEWGHLFKRRSGCRNRVDVRGLLLCGGPQGSHSRLPLLLTRTCALQVIIRDNNVDQALRVLKKKVQREGVFREMTQRKAYEKPSERKTREKAE